VSCDTLAKCRWNPLSQSWKDCAFQRLRIFSRAPKFSAEPWVRNAGMNASDSIGFDPGCRGPLHFGKRQSGGRQEGLSFTSRKYREAYPPDFEGLDVARFLEDFQFCFQELIDHQQTYPGRNRTEGRPGFLNTPTR